MYQMMNRSENMGPAAQAEGMFSCANIAVILDTITMVSIILISLLGLLISSGGKGPFFG
ncbi:MAG: hypothetical protein IJE22_05405 [Oscillibacter sp.]|nr:hypothetical protein [Oscillibacter sp.]MBQ2996650.1 hypothetical protein [Oscillibacter sp.]